MTEKEKYQKGISDFSNTVEKTEYKFTPQSDEELFKVRENLVNKIVGDNGLYKDNTIYNLSLEAIRAWYLLVKEARELRAQVRDLEAQ